MIANVLTDVHIVIVDENSSGLSPVAESAVPGKPSFLFENI